MSSGRRPVRRRFRLRNRWHRCLESVFGLARWASGGLAVVSAFVLGVWVNAVSDPQLGGLADAVGRIYDIKHRPLSWIAVLATALLVVVPLVRFGLYRVVGTAGQALTRFDALAERAVDPELRRFAGGRLAWGSQLVLQSCPRITEGWRPEEVRVIVDPTEYRWPSLRYRDAYVAWLDGAEDFVHRGPVKYRLMANPASFLDDPGLELRIQPNRFAEAVFVHRELSRRPADRLGHVQRVLDGDVVLPQALVLHLTVATRDGFVLLTQRSHKVVYHPRTWSYSIEEQLSTEDLAYDESSVIACWVARALGEELGVRRAEATGGDVRILAVFLEADILNVAIAALVTLDLDRERLDGTIRGWPRKDYEFGDWDFIAWSDLASHLVRPDRRLHPSSGLRMFLAGIVKFGVHGFCAQVDRELAR